MLKKYESVYKKKKLRENFETVTPLEWSKTYFFSFEEAESFSRKKNWLIPLWEELKQAYENKKIKNWEIGKYLTSTPIREAAIRGVHFGLNVLKNRFGKQIIKKDVVAGLEKTNVKFIVSYIDQDGKVVKNKNDKFLSTFFNIGKE